MLKNSKRSMDTPLHAIKSPNIQGVLLGDLIKHIRVSLKRLHYGVLPTMSVWFVDRSQKIRRAVIWNRR
ncbi:MAG: hypothetical protein GXP59_00955 [Deltaproteobacteria bacterium]|nr:hypothetical protein [Deltaproteobacteria bacterium]